MMLSRQLGALTAALFTVGASAACSSDLQIDNWSNYASAVNSMNDATSDDESMDAIGASNGVLHFKPKDVNSYYYESFPCVKAKSQGYGGLQFTLEYPASSTFTIEIQTKKSCNAANYTSEWFPISGLSGQQQVVTLDLGVFAESNTDAIVGFVFAGFDPSGDWSLSDMKFVCGDLGALEPPERNPNPTPSGTRPATIAEPVPFKSSATTPSSLEPFPSPPTSVQPPPPPPPPPPSPSPTSSSSIPPPPPPPPPPPSLPPSSPSSSSSSVPPSSATSTSISSSVTTIPTSALSMPTISTPTRSPLPPLSSPTLSSSSSVLSSGPTSNSGTTSFWKATSPTRPHTGSTSSASTSSASTSSASTSSASISPLPVLSTLMTVPKPALSLSSVEAISSTQLQQLPAPELTMTILPRAPPSGEATTTRKSVIATTTTIPKPKSLDDCQNLLIDDWESQSRLTFLYYNSMLSATSDDGTMKSVKVNNDNTVSLTPTNSDSYFYSQMPCVDATDIYGGISMKIQAAAGTTFSIQLTSSSACGGTKTTTQTISSSSLEWRFDGNMREYSFRLSDFSRIDDGKITMIYLTNFNRGVTLGPMSFYCGDEPSVYPAPAHKVNPVSTYQVAAPAGTASALVIDTFDDEDLNNLGQWHGCDEDCVHASYGNNRVTLQTNDSDVSWYTALADKCADISAYSSSYLHVSYTGSNKFTISLQQANSACNNKIAPFPETWDSLEAARYASSTDIYIPISHFNVNLGRITNFAFKGFYTTASTVLRKIELVPSVPAGWKMPNKLPTGNLVFACKRPNSFAFAIDDGDPALAQQVMEIVRSENIKVTFFTVGLPLEDPSTNLSTVYKDMMSRGHQLALHSFTHPKMEGLPDYAAIDWEYNNDIAAVEQTFGGLHTPYFRPPFGTEGARMRHRLAAALKVNDPYFVMWSVDVEDWLWGTSDTPEKQLDAFRRDINKGGNLVVMHYLYPNTVKYLRQFIQLAKATGKQLMRVDQCMMDPKAPPL